MRPLWERIRRLAASLPALCERHPRATVAGAMFASTLLSWAPFLERPNVLYRYWDGPHYVYLAKTLYDVPSEHPFAPYRLTPSYYATHLPAYPLSIRLLTPLTFGRYLPAMLLATLLAAIAAALLFHELLRREQLVASPLFTAVLFAFLPPRWVLYHSVGASEPLFLAAVFAALLAYRERRTGWLLAAIALASLTRIMGVLLVPAFMAAAALEGRRRDVRLLPLALLASGALLVAHGLLYGDVLAYFSRNLDQAGHLRPTPVMALGSYAATGNPHSAELYYGLYALYGLGTLALARHRPIFFYSLAFFALDLFVYHADLSRMFLPIAPFALLVGFDALLSRPACRLALPLVAWLDCLYVWGLIPQNAVAPDVYLALLRVLER